MEFCLDDLDDAHEMWQKANGRCNSRTFLAMEVIRKSQNADVVEGAPANLSDIDELFQKKGRGPHMLELEFDKVTDSPIDYLQRTRSGVSTGVTLQKWLWLHRLTPGRKNNPVTRYVNTSGKTFDTGKLSKYLMNIDEKNHPAAYQRAQHILQLNGSLLSDTALEEGVHSRELLVLQQVSTLVCFVFIFSFYSFSNSLSSSSSFESQSTGQVSDVCH
jgi:hypothetical protein